MKTFGGTVIEVKVNVPIKKRYGGYYDGWRLVYRDEEDGVKTLEKPMAGLKNSPFLRKSIEELAPGDAFVGEMEKNEGGFWEVLSLSKGGEMPRQANKPEPLQQPQRQYRSDRTERDDKVQTYIIRQNSLGNAVSFLKDKKDAKASDVFTLAEEFEKWVLREEKKQENNEEVE